ncbi:MAG: PilZ domain-containing protein [Polyangiaceae bacterium]|nr:PilZ domain-containing protein [Polyangiaceae bacterium]
MVDKRQHPRSPVTLDASVRRSTGEAHEARVVDLSFGGAFVEIAAPFAFGDEVTLSLELPELGRSELPATVRWTKPGGVGLQFGLLGARVTHALGALVARAG